MRFTNGTKVKRIDNTTHLNIGNNFRHENQTFKIQNQIRNEKEGK